MQQTPDDNKKSKIDRLRDVDVSKLEKGVAKVEGLTPEQEQAGDRKGGLMVRETIRFAKRAGVWTVYAFCVLVMIAFLVAFCKLMWVYVADISAKPEEVKAFLHEAVEWLVVALAALFVDRKLRD